jgi:hypothetical protein
MMSAPRKSPIHQLCTASQYARSPMDVSARKGNRDDGAEQRRQQGRHGEGQHVF